MKRLVLILLAAGCQPASPQPTGDAYDVACAHLAQLACPEGLASNCAAAMRHADQAHLTPVPVPCLTAAASPAEAQACGFVECAP